MNPYQDESRETEDELHQTVNNEYEYGSRLEWIQAKVRSYVLNGDVTREEMLEMVKEMFQIMTLESAYENEVEEVF